MTISIIGAGRLGLCLAVSLAEAGLSVLITDKNFKKKEIFEGKPYFYEPELEDRLLKNKSRLTWTRYVDKILSSDCIFFCSSLPQTKKGELDLTELLEWVELIPKDKTKLIVIKSTCPLGTHQKITKLLEEKKSELVICPEFLREGHAFKDLIQPERVVIGANNISAGQKLEKLYRQFSKAKLFIHTDFETAELSKLVSSSFLGLKMSFINEWAEFCEKTNANIEDLQKILSSDPRIGTSFLNSGLGYGGQFPQDIQLSILEGKKRNKKLALLKKAQDRNELLPDDFFKSIKKYYKSLRGLSLAFWGVTSKKHTDSLKHSPALNLICRLLKAGIIAHIYDPLFTKENVMKLFKQEEFTGFKNKDLQYLQKKILKGKSFFHKNALSALNNRQGLVVCVPYDEFKETSLDLIKSKLSKPFLVDGRGLYSSQSLKKHGFSFYQKGVFYVGD